MKAKRKARLKKGPEVSDYLVQSIYSTAASERIEYNYFLTRKAARDYVKEYPAPRTRVFRIKYTLVSDSKK